MTLQVIKLTKPQVSMVWFAVHRDLSNTEMTPMGLRAAPKTQIIGAEGQRRYDAMIEQFEQVLGYEPAQRPVTDEGNWIFLFADDLMAAEPNGGAPAADAPKVQRTYDLVLDKEVLDLMRQFWEGFVRSGFVQDPAMSAIIKGVDRAFAAVAEYKPPPPKATDAGAPPADPPAPPVPPSLDTPPAAA